MELNRRPAFQDRGLRGRRILQPIGWHTFRHTYSSLLRQNRTDIKVTQELLRHASSRVTLDTYTQAVTLHKRKAQSDVVRLLGASRVAGG
jgi:integrase